MLARQVAILEVVSASERLLALTEIADAVGLPASSTHRLLGVLCDAELLRRTPWRTYMVGARLRELASGVLTQAEAPIGPAR